MTWVLRALIRFKRDQRGAAMVELALVAGVIFIPLMFGVVEIGRGVWIKSMVTAAAREGVRYAIVHGSQNTGSVADSAAIADTVIARTKLTGIIVRPSWPDGNNDYGSRVRVQVSYSYVPVVSVISARTITSTSQQIISY
jgi:Flp pilus assembly protein TadG